MSTPSDDEVFKMQQELNGLVFSWQQLGALLTYQARNNTAPPHPPAALQRFLEELRDNGMIFPSMYTEETWHEALSMFIAIFRWAQICVKNDITYDNLVQCTCDKMSKSDFDEIYKYMSQFNPGANT